VATAYAAWPMLLIRLSRPLSARFRRRPVGLPLCVPFRASGFVLPATVDGVGAPVGLMRPLIVCI
jgi:hypothetical protein